MSAGRAEEAGRVREQALQRIESLAIRIVDPAWRASFTHQTESHAALLARRPR